MQWFVSYYYFFPLIVFIVSVYGVRLLHEYRELTLPTFKKHLNIILFLVAVLLGLGILPSAPWYIYTVYYYLPIILGFSVALDYYSGHTFNHYLKRCVLVLTGALTLWYSYGMMPKLYMLLYAGPFLLTAFLIRRMTAMRTMLIIIVPMLLFRTVEMMSSKVIYERAYATIKEAQGLVLAGGMFNFCGENIFPLEGLKTQISSSQGTNIIELKSIESVHTDLINAHPLVKLFGSTHRSHKESKWVSRRSLGNEFQLIINSTDVWKMQDCIERQVKPLHYSVTKEIPLSNKLLDRYAAPAYMRGLKCIEYRRANPTP
jgi:hypothetical protein